MGIHGIWKLDQAPWFCGEACCSSVPKAASCNGGNPRMGEIVTSTFFQDNELLSLCFKLLDLNILHFSCLLMKRLSVLNWLIVEFWLLVGLQRYAARNCPVSESLFRGYDSVRCFYLHGKILEQILFRSKQCKLSEWWQYPSPWYPGSEQLFHGWPRH